jgi:hypothetical protein
MPNFYDDSKFGVIQRQWFGLTTKWGGAVVNTGNLYTFGTTDATARAQLARWYPRGPIRMVKAGTFNLATVANASVDRIPVRLLTRGASASLGALFYNAKGNQAVIASTTTFTVKQVKAGEYLTIRTGTPQTDKGTAANTATTTGTVAFFVDYVPTYDPTGKWDVT